MVRDSNLTVVGIKIVGFLGVAPKISPELLPNTAGQVARNCKLYSGDLIPYPQPVVVGNTGRTGPIKTLFALRDPTTGEKKWLSWVSDVDIAVASKTDKEEQRFYYTGDGVPKVSNYKLATSGAPPYPVAYYDLGLPIPEDNAKLSATAVKFTTKTTVSYARDISNVVTIVTSTPHGLRSGNFVSVSGFIYVNGTYTQSSTTITVTINDHGLSEGAQVSLDFTSGGAIDGTYIITNVTPNTFDVISSVSQDTSGDVRLDIRNLNASNVECTVIDSTTFTYFSPGPAIATTLSSAGRVELSGLPRSRSYVFTWYTPWEEESIASKPSSELFIKEGATVVVSNFPTTKPAGNNFIRGVRLYRTVSSAAGSDYFLLSILWFPIDIVKVSRDSATSISTITTRYPHNLGTDDRFLIAGLTGEAASFNAAGTVLDVVDKYTFKFEQSSLSGVPETTVTDGFVYHDISEDPLTMPPRYWGYTLTGTYSQTGGTTITVTTSSEHKLAVNSKIYLKFNSGTAVSGVYTIDSVTSNTFTVTAETAASTSGDVTVDGYIFIDDFDSRILSDTLESDNYDPPPKDLRGLTVIQNNILCGFVGNTLYFSEPGRPHAWPASYAVNLEHNIVGIAAIGGSALVVTDSYPYLVSGSDPANGMATARIDVNLPCLNKNSIVTMDYGIVYSTHDGLAMYSPTSGPTVVTKLLYNNDTWKVNIDPATVVAEYYDGNYFASHSTGAFTFEQDAKVGGFFVDLDYSFFASWYDTLEGVVYYVADVSGDVYKWDDLSQPSTIQRWKSKVIVTNDFVNLGAARVIADYTTGENGVVFRLWVDKQLLFETTVFDSGVFRLPTGYRSDTFEVEVESKIRIRAIHLAETPLGLGGF